MPHNEQNKYLFLSINMEIPEIYLQNVNVDIIHSYNITDAIKIFILNEDSLKIINMLFIFINWQNFPYDYLNTNDNEENIILLADIIYKYKNTYIEDIKYFYNNNIDNLIKIFFNLRNSRFFKIIEI